MEPLPIPPASYWTIQRTDPTGRALALYLFYVQAAIKQDSSQPLASDQFCANGLRWNIKTVRIARAKLAEAGMIDHVHKQSYRYVRIHYLNGKLVNGRFELSATPIPAGVMGTTGVFDHYSQWWDRLTNGCIDEFVKRLKKQMNTPQKPDTDAVYHHLNTVYNRINATGYGIMEIDSELRFWGYLLKSVAVEFEWENRRKMKVA